MKRMPSEIKNKLRQIQKTVAKASQLQAEFHKMIEEYDLNLELFTADANLGFDEQTEAFTFITYNEGNVEDNIKEIEKVFLLHVNKKE